MAKSVSTCKIRRFQSSFFSESEIDVAIQLIHLSEDSDNHDEISGCTSCSDAKSIASATSSAKNGGGMEHDEISRSRGTAALVGDIFEEIGDGANRRRRKRRSRSVYEIYKLTKPVISVK